MQRELEERGELLFESKGGANNGGRRTLAVVRTLCVSPHVSARQRRCTAETIPPSRAAAVRARRVRAPPHIW